MVAITVYSKPSCVQCAATYRALESRGLEYEVVDLSSDTAALEVVKALGYLQAPVVITPDQHWSGFRPDKIAAITPMRSITMAESPNPYDSGYRLEPRVWVQNGVTGQEDPRPSIPDDYGRVDFEDDEGNAAFTAWIQKTEAGYILRVDEHQNVELAVETSSQRHAREAAMMQLDSALQVVAASYPEAIALSEQDPDTFGAGHYVYENSELNQRLVITEQYAGTDSSDPDRIPNGWKWEAGKVTDSDGVIGWTVTDKGEVAAEKVEQLIDEVKGWAQTQARDFSTQAALRAPAAMNAGPHHTQAIRY